MQREVRDAAATHNAHMEALDLAQQGLTQLEDALAKEQALHQDTTRKVGLLHSMLCGRCLIRRCPLHVHITGGMLLGHLIGRSAG